MRKHHKGTAVGKCLLLALTGLGLGGCGSDSDDPTAVTLEDLKAPVALQIEERGNGEFALSWGGGNNEDDFDGYNIYGVKCTSESESVCSLEGTALQLLDSEAKAVTAAKEQLQKMNFNGTDLETVAALQEDQATSTESTEEKKFAFYPIYENKDAEDKPILPTCAPSSGTCAATTTETASATGIKLNGRVTYAPKFKLSVGSKYCFLVLSTMDDAEEVSQTSSNVACITPRYKAKFSVTFSSTVTAQQLDLATLRADCVSDISSCNVADKHLTADSCPNEPTTTTIQICFEKGSDKLPVMTPMKTTFKQLGYLPSGVNDKDLPRPLPKLSSAYSTEANEVAPFTPFWMSRPLAKNSLYWLVSPTAADPLKANYDFLFLSSDITTSTSTIEGYLWLSKDAE